MTQQPYYPPQPPQGPPPQQAPQYPSYPPQGPPQQYQQPYYPPQAPQQYGPPPVQQQLAQGSLDDFYNQPSSGGGPSLKFEQIGTRYIGIVTRPIGQGDVQQQTDTQGRPLFFKDGRPKWVMKVPLQMQPTGVYTDGLAQWYVKGQARDELVRAMAEAHAPEGAPEQGSILDIEFTGTRQSGVGMNPAKMFRVHYTRPEGAAPAPQPVQQGVPQPVQQAPAPQQPVQPLPPQYGQPDQGALPPLPASAYPPGAQPLPMGPSVGTVYTPNAAAQQTPQQAPAAPSPVAGAQQGVQQGVPQPPSDLSDEQKALLARLTGVQQVPQG